MTQKQKSLIGGVSVLGLAGLICKVVGVLYRIPLASVVGGEGLGIYQKVFPAYNLLLTVSSAGIPVAISRMVSHYLTLGDARNAKRIFRVAVIALTALGVVTTAILLLLSDDIAAWQGTPAAAQGYLCIAPSLLFVCVMSAFRGYMQGRRDMMPTAISQLIEQVGKVAVALPFAAIGMARGGMAWGAAGALLGTSLAEAAALVYMMIRYKREKPLAVPGDQPHRSKRLGRRLIAKRLIIVSIPITLGACIVPLAGFIDSVMLTNIMEGFGMAADEALIRYGMYSGMVLTLINVPTALAMAMSVSLVPDVAAGRARKDMEYVARESGTGLRMAAVVGFPCSVGMSLLAKPLLFLFYSGKYTDAQLTLSASLLEISSLTIVLFTVVQATSGILQGIGKQKIPMYTLIAGVACKIALNYTLVRVPEINIHGAPYASLLCYAVSMLPNLYFVCRHTGYRFSWMDVIVRPLGATAAMGVVVWLSWTYGFGERFLSSGRGLLLVAVLACVAIGVAAYLAAAWVLRAVRPEDLPARIRRRLKR